MPSTVDPICPGDSCRSCQYNQYSYRLIKLAEHLLSGHLLQHIYLETETDTERARERENQPEKQRERQREAIRSPNDVILSHKMPKDIVKQASRVSQNAIQNELLLGFLSFGLQF